MKDINKIIEYGLYLLVFLLPIQTRWIIKGGELNGGYSEYSTISLYGTDIFLFALFILFVLRKLQIQNYPATAGPRQGGGKFQSASRRTKLQIPNYWYFIAGLELFIFISIFFAPDKLLAVFNYARFLLGVGLFWLIVSAEYNKIKLLWSLIAGAAIQAGLGIWQSLNQSSFASKWLGIAEHKPFDLGTSVVEAMGSDGIWERWLRAYGGLDHPNILGGFLVVVLLLLIILFVNSKSKMSLRAVDEAIPAKHANRDCFVPLAMTVIFFTSYFLLLTSLFFTFSRGAWAGFLTGLIVMLIILFWQKKEKEMKKILELIFTGAIIILFLFNLYSNLVLTRLSKDTRLEIKSNTERVESYKTAKEIIKKHWFFGVGTGNYTLALKNEIKSPYTPFDKGGQQPSWYYQPVHNTFLLIWAETGILGLMGFLGIMLCVMRYPLRRSESEASVLCGKRRGGKVLDIVLVFSVISTLTVMMLVDHWYWSLHFGVLFFWLLAGVIIKKEKVG